MTNKAFEDEAFDDEEAIEDGDWSEPQRDERGRYLKGYTGNPSGRPRKPPKKSWSVERSLAEAFAETVRVAGPDGKSESLAIRDLLLKNFARNCVKAKPKDQMAIFERLVKLGALDTTPEEDEEPEEIWTEEDRRILELVQREVGNAAVLCCQCEKPVFEQSAGKTTLE